MCLKHIDTVHIASACMPLYMQIKVNNLCNVAILRTHNVGMPLWHS